MRATGRNSPQTAGTNAGCHWASKRDLHSEVPSAIIRHLSGILIDSVRSKRRIQALKIMMRSFGSSLLRSLTMMLYGSRRVRSRQEEETEFPVASSRDGGTGNLLERTFRGRRAADRASLDALRPSNHWVNIEDQYELSFIREAFAPVARRLSTSARCPWASTRRTGTSAQENILAASRGVFWRRRNSHQKACHSWPA